MTSHSSNDSQEKKQPVLQIAENSDLTESDRPTKARIRLRIPKEYTDEPVISQLVSNYGVTVNITAALLGANARDDGWFDLELQGTSQQIQSALTYLDEMKMEIWNESSAQENDW